MRRNKGKVQFKTDEQIEKIRVSCQLVSRTLGLIGEILRPGVTGEEIDKQAETFIRDNKAVPGFKGLYGFPSTLCISHNDIVVHGIPSKRVFKSGDIVSIDCGVLFDGFYGDAAYTFVIGEIDASVMKLLAITKEALYKGIEKAVIGNRVGDIGSAIYEFAEKTHGYGIVRELVGHGVGKNLHEEPDVPNHGKRGKGMLLREGVVLAIEPMINLGKKEVKQAKDGWAIYSIDHKPSAHYEHTVAVRKFKADILSTHSFVEEAIKKNIELTEVSLKSQIFAD